MKRIIVIGITIFFVMASCSGLSLAEKPDQYKKISLSYKFETPKLNKVNIEDTTYDQVIVEGATCFGNPGEPLLPMKGAYILLPKDTEASEIKVTYSEEISLGMGYNIEPVGEIVPTSMVAKSSLKPDENIYSSEDMFPGSLFSKVGTYSYRGYNILVLTMYPVQYIPSTGELIYYPGLSVDVETEQTQKNLLYRGLEKDKNEVLKKVDNPQILSTYEEQKHIKTTNQDQYDLLILTTSEFKNSFNSLKTAHETNGIVAEIKTLNDISLVPGSVTPEDIREFVKDEYLEHGIEYLLIGGDVGVIPHKMLYVSGYDEDRWFYDDEMPVDQYYGYLDGPFNFDGDELWGEPNDGENGEDVDLLAEICVGRACADTVQDVNNFVHKTVSYLNTDIDDEYLSKVILAGEYLGDHGVSSFGGNLLDALIDGTDRDGFTTVGIPSEKYTIETIYDRDWPGFSTEDPWNTGWNAYDIIDRVNDDIHILTHDGHSSYGYNMKMTNDYVSEFTNDKYCFMYSTGCMAGGFDDPHEYDCYAETLTVKTNTGAFAGIWNARYGFFWSQRTDGDGSMFLRQFWDAVYGENIPIIGKANQDSKEDNLYLLQRSMMRWTYYQLNLFGDPSVAFHISAPPEKPLMPEGPSSGKADEEYTYTSTATEPDGEQIYYLFKWGDGTDSGWLGPIAQGVGVDANHVWTEKGSYDIRVKAKDVNGVEGPWSDSLSVSITKSRTKSLLLQRYIESLKQRDLPLIENLLNFL